VRPANWISQNGNREQRYIVQLQMADGRTEFVDVGSQSKLQDMELKSGDQVNFKGHYTTVNGRRVFMADIVRVNGDRFTVQRNQGGQREQLSQGQSGNSNPAASQTVQGKIQGFRHVYLRSGQGQREQHSLVKLQLQDGRSLVVDLGRKADLDELDLQKGENITLRGRRGMVDGRPVLFADRIQAGDETIRIARSGAGQQNQASTSSDSNQEKPFTLRGKVAGYQVVTMQSGQKQVSLLNLALEDGRSVLIDAGNKRSELDLKDLDLRDQAVIKGHTKNIEGRQVLVADSVQFLSSQQSQQSAVGRAGQEQKSSGSGSSSGQNQSEQDRQNQQP